MQSFLFPLKRGNQIMLLENGRKKKEQNRYFIVSLD